MAGGDEGSHRCGLYGIRLSLNVSHLQRKPRVKETLCVLCVLCVCRN